jgi:hypothetical protein
MNLEHQWCHLPNRKPGKHQQQGLLSHVNLRRIYPKPNFMH